MDTFSTTGYYFSMLEQCDIEQDIFESMAQYDFKLASLGPVNESTISEEDKQCLQEMSENIFRKIWRGIVKVAKAIKDFFINIGKFIKKLFSKNTAKKAIVNNQIKEAEDAAKQDKVIVDQEIIEDAINQAKDDGNEAEIVEKISNITNTESNEKSLKDTISKVSKPTSFTTDSGIKKKGAMVDQEVAKVIINKSQYNEPCGPQLETVKYKMISPLMARVPISGINNGHLINTFLEFSNIVDFLSMGGSDAKDESELIINAYNRYTDKGKEHPELSKTPLTAHRVERAMYHSNMDVSRSCKIIQDKGISGWLNFLVLDGSETDCTVKKLNNELDCINDWIETSVKKQDETIKDTEKIEKMKETAVEKLMTEAGISTEVFSVINSTIQSQMQFNKIFVVPFINALQARYKYLTDVVAKKFTMGIIITPKSKEN